MYGFTLCIYICGCDLCGWPKCVVWPGSVRMVSCCMRACRYARTHMYICLYVCTRVLRLGLCMHVCMYVLCVLHELYVRVLCVFGGMCLVMMICVCT